MTTTAESWAEFRASIEPEIDARRPKTLADFLESRTKEKTRYVSREQSRERSERMRWIKKKPRRNRRAIQ